MKSKIFVPNEGLFQLMFPLDWEYKLTQGHIHQFTFEKGIGSFHLSLLGEKARNTFNRIRKNPKTIRRQFPSIPVFEFSIEVGQPFSTIVWHFEKDKILFLASYTYTASLKGSPAFDNEINHIVEIIDSIRIIEPLKRDQEVAWFRFGKFMEGIHASAGLYERASKNGCFIECVCLLANQIDAMLRVANILYDQIQSKEKKMEVSLVYQGPTDKRMSEKDIYKLSKDKSIIDQDTFDELYKVYEERNKVVHRYIISEITTRNVLEIAITYSGIHRKIWQIVHNLETKQMELGLGMTTTSSQMTKGQIEDAERIMAAALKEKHGGIDF